jgi:hypothetical protein
MTTMQDTRIHQLEARIWAKDVELLYAKTMRDRHTKLSSMGWLTSIHTLAAGTLVAVFAGQVASRWSDEVARIEHERTRLLARLDDLTAI